MLPEAIIIGLVESQEPFDLKLNEPFVKTQPSPLEFPELDTRLGELDD